MERKGTAGAAVQPAEPEAVEWKAAYERLVDYDLHLLAELYGWMKKKGLAEHTLLLVLGDHGEAFGEHGQRIHPSRNGQ